MTLLSENDMLFHSLLIYSISHFKLWTCTEVSFPGQCFSLDFTGLSGVTPGFFFAPHSLGFCCRYYLLIFIIFPLATMCSSVPIPFLIIDFYSGAWSRSIHPEVSHVLLIQENSGSRSNLEVMI